MSMADIFIARQPIFDRQELVSGYEILFRSGPENRFEARDVDLAAHQGLERTVMSFGFDDLTNGKLAFVNLSRRVLLTELYALLPPNRSVVELLETIEPDAEVIAACHRLKGQGYRLALDDFTYRPGFDPLLELADIVKIDFRDPAARTAEAIERAGRHGASLLAEKIETQDERLEAEQAGFELFQGYYYCRPEMLKNRAPSPTKTNYLRLLREVGQQEVEFERVEAIIRQELAFSVRLLRYLNSAGFGWRYQVDTLNHALRLLGVKQLRKWVSAVATVGLAEGKPEELVTTALFRARLAELLADPVGLTQADLQLFFGGLLSVMDAVMDQPLEQVVGSMGVSPELAAGVLRREPPFGPVLDLVVAQERGDFSQMESLAGRLGAQPDRVQEAYRSAANWASALAAAA
ncbi:MAG: HDOD domain-containing protein [Gemmatimonadales bacterium]|nr:HDOD domain-containing protein [Gemmatimonadales bacterium]